jgi:UDP-glucuronate 4-epimerase
VNCFRDNVNLYRAKTTCTADPATINALYWVFNIDNSQPTPLLDHIQALENDLGTQAQKHNLPKQSDDVPATNCRIQELDDWVGFKPSMPVGVGVQHFVNWYRLF